MKAIMSRLNNDQFFTFGAQKLASSAEQSVRIECAHDSSSIFSEERPPSATVQQNAALEPTASKWLTSFRPEGELRSVEGSNSQERSTSSKEKVELYDPYDLGSSESESEAPQGQHHDHSHQPNLRLSYEGHALGTCCHDDHHRWGTQESYSQLVTNQPPEPVSQVGPGQNSFSVSSLMMPTSDMSPSYPFGHYGDQTSNGEDSATISNARKELTSTIRLSPPRLTMDLQPSIVSAEADYDQVMPLSQVTSSLTDSTCTDRGPFTCDLCEVEFVNLQELEDHLESRSHWETLEHIQQHRNYDDLTVAFLQEVMLYKVRQCNQAMEQSAIQALQDKDFITKVEMLHCAPCKVYFCTSAHSVQTHLNSPQHLLNKKMFRWRQRQSCLAKAETMMKELMPQYEQFIQGDSPFE